MVHGMGFEVRGMRYGKRVHFQVGLIRITIPDNSYLWMFKMHNYGDLIY